MTEILTRGSTCPAGLALVSLALATASAWASDAALLESKPGDRWRFGGAVGATLGHGPAYSGASDTRTSLRPAALLRYGPISLSSTSGLSPRADTGGGEALRGLGVSLVRSERVRLSLSLRYDSGRDGAGSGGESADAAAAVPETLRARLRASYRFAPGWRLAGSVSLDALGRGAGAFADVGLSREGRFGDATGWTAGVLLAAADRRYMTAYHGVTPEAAARSGRAAYAPGAGWRDVGLSFRTSTELGAQWQWINTAGVSRLLGPAAASPLTDAANGWALSSTLAWRF
ncbi:MAG: MipA/OmpV family protein [Rubrivivax sp.]|nr:MipA/OmpV family protein [Rubrivivax sp.]